MEELIYLLVKLIEWAVSDKSPKSRPSSATQWQQIVREQQRRLQQAQLAASRRSEFAPPPRVVIAQPVQPVQPVAFDVPTATRSSQRQADGVPGGDIARLMTPGSLRRRFILTEILRPPVSLRPPRI